jgi:hypothetical protein
MMAFGAVGGEIMSTARPGPGAPAMWTEFAVLGCYAGAALPAGLIASLCHRRRRLPVRWLSNHRD